MTSPEPPGTPSTVRLDARSLRGLAHPLRVRLLGLLREHGPATASGLARTVGESSGVTSYHLRQLAEHGLVVEDEVPDASRRERWWRAAHRVDDPRAPARPRPRDRGARRRVPAGDRRGVRRPGRAVRRRTARVCGRRSAPSGRTRRTSATGGSTSPRSRRATSHRDRRGARALPRVRPGRRSRARHPSRRRPAAAHADLDRPRDARRRHDHDAGRGRRRGQPTRRGSGCGATWPPRWSRPRAPGCRWWPSRGSC